MDSMQDLLDAAKQGNIVAEEQLFSKLRARISDLVKYKLQRSPKHQAEVEEDAKDLVSEIMDTIYQKYKSSEFQYGFIGWVNSIVWRKVGNYIRRERKRVRFDSDLENLQDDREGSLDEMLEKKELRELIYRTLEKMKSPCKAIMDALFEEEISVYISRRKKEVPLGTIYSQIHRCRERFREMLQKQGFEYEVYQRKYRTPD